MVDQIPHPDDENSKLPVRVIDEESHRGHEMVQVEAYSPKVTLTDKSGDPPWVFREALA